MAYAATDVILSEYAIDLINKIRFKYDKNQLYHDYRGYDLALARAKDMYRYDYLDHKNSHTGTCPNNLKSKFGFELNESLIENIAKYDIENDVSNDPPLTEIIDAWMNSADHRYYLLYHDYKAGGFACYSGYCSFLGISDGGYTGSSSIECQTAKDDKEFFAKLASCSDQKMLEYESLQKQFKEMRTEYEKIPSVAHSEIEYLKAQKTYNMLDDLRRKLESFKC